MFKATISDLVKKIEGDVLQTIFANLRSFLNMGFLAFFYMDFLDSEQEASYREKIRCGDFDSLISRKTVRS